MFTRSPHRGNEDYGNFMNTRPLGPFHVSAVGLGGMPLSIRGRPDAGDAIRVIHAAIDGGMTLIDTADCYCLDDADFGHNERLIAAALRERRSRGEVIIATKGGLRRPKGAWTSDASPAHLRHACEASLRALGVECIDVYQLHAPDDDVPFADSVGEMARLLESGKIRSVGLSNVSSAEIALARDIVPVVSVQNRCHPLDTRAFSEGVIDACRAANLAFLAYSPVGGSWERAAVAEHPALLTVGRRIGASAPEVALAWLLAQGQEFIVIPGASRVASAESSIRAGHLTLTAADLAALNSAFLP